MAFAKEAIAAAAAAAGGVTTLLTLTCVDLILGGKHRRGKVHWPHAIRIPLSVWQKKLRSFSSWFHQKAICICRDRWNESSPRVAFSN